MRPLPFLCRAYAARAPHTLYKNVRRDLMRENLFSGCGTALATPFKGNRVDYDCLEQMIDWQIESGADALILLGTTGEPCTITDSERSAMIECAVARCAGQIPLIVGTGSNCTETAKAYSREAARMGADGVLVVAPYYNKSSDAGLIEHFRCIADCIEIPMILYNVPSRTGYALPTSVVSTLAEHPMIRGFKQADASISASMHLFNAVRGKMTLYCGNDDLILPMMAMGASGAISVAANIIPQTIHNLTIGCIRGEIEASRDLQYAIEPLLQALLTCVNPIPIKAALSLMGKYENSMRAPLYPMAVDQMGQLRAAMEELNLISKKTA